MLEIFLPSEIYWKYHENIPLIVLVLSLVILLKPKKSKIAVLKWQIPFLKLANLELLLLGMSF